MSVLQRPGAALRAMSGRAARAIRRVAAAIDLADTARPLRNAQTRGQWLTVGQEVMTALLEGAEVEDVLTLIAARLRVVAEADAVALVLAGVDDEWVIEIADGDRDDLVGLVMPAGGRARRVLSERSGIVVPSFHRTTSELVKFAGYGPALYAPMVVGRRSTGVIILLRARGAAEFTLDELQIAETFARQAALALELAAARADAGRAALLDERARIARDLHDLAIQQLFATGLQISRVREQLPDAAANQLGEALDGLDDAVVAIRSIVHALRRQEHASRLVARLERELVLAHPALGFSATLQLDADTLDRWAATAEQDLLDDVVAVVREGLSNAARHAQASAVVVAVTSQAQADAAAQLVVTVADDGGGIPADRTRSSGLANLGARAVRWGGRCVVEPGPGGGTVLTWTAR